METNEVYCKHLACARYVLPPYIYCDEHADKASTPQISQVPVQQARAILVELYRAGYDAGKSNLPVNEVSVNQIESAVSKLAVSEVVDGK